MVAVSTNLKLVKEFGIDPEVGCLEWNGLNARAEGTDSLRLQPLELCLLVFPSLHPLACLPSQNASGCWGLAGGLHSNHCCLRLLNAPHSSVLAQNASGFWDWVGGLHAGDPN